MYFIPLVLAALFTSGAVVALLTLQSPRYRDLMLGEDPPLFWIAYLLRLRTLHREWERMLLLSLVGAILYWVLCAVTYPGFEGWLHEAVLALPPILVLGLYALSEMNPRIALRIAAPIASLCLLPLAPFVALIRSSPDEEPSNPAHLFPTSMGFEERVAKEVMVPRVDLFGILAETPIRTAVKQFTKEGYSRVPLFRETLDEIIGVVLYKDLLRIVTDPRADLDAPIETLSKPVLYAPENKKIAQLLQEFRAKQLHMAIIVDEYGGTEGIVTIEDILEELVGEIEDEYDIEGPPFLALPSGGWVVDAKMSILDIEDQIGIQIPQSPEYETIGGYIFDQAGTIPPKGWRLTHDRFDLEVLSSNERSIKKIKITPHTLDKHS